MAKKKKEVVDEYANTDEYYVRVFDEEKHKLVFITTICAKTKESAIKKIEEDYKNQPYSFYAFQ